ncbi:MAG TPA: hypothetical protein VG148_01440 [Pyrinomonadaceae bacterium]|nr:hypothetical protein [Pyrinomonadaceae bacterium]
MTEDRSKEILNYLSAIVREVGDLRQETKTRLDTLELSVKVLVSDVGDLRRHSEVLDARVERFDARMERFEGALDDMRRSVRLLNHKFGFVSEEIAELRADDRDLRKRIEAVEKKVGMTGEV